MEAYKLVDLNSVDSEYYPYYEGQPIPVGLAVIKGFDGGLYLVSLEKYHELTTVAVGKKKKKKLTERVSSLGIIPKLLLTVVFLFMIVVLIVTGIKIIEKIDFSKKEEVSVVEEEPVVVAKNSPVKVVKPSVEKATERREGRAVSSEVEDNLAIKLTTVGSYEKAVGDYVLAEYSKYTDAERVPPSVAATYVITSYLLTGKEIWQSGTTKNYRYLVGEKKKKAAFRRFARTGKAWFEAMSDGDFSGMGLHMKAVYASQKGFFDELDQEAGSIKVMANVPTPQRETRSYTPNEIATIEQVSGDKFHYTATDKSTAERKNVVVRPENSKVAEMLKKPKSGTVVSSAEIQKYGLTEEQIVVVRKSGGDNDDLLNISELIKKGYTFSQARARVL